MVKDVLKEVLEECLIVEPNNKPTYEELEAENKKLKAKLESLRAVISKLTNLAS